MFSYGNRELETQAIRYLRGIGAKGMFVMPCHGSYYNTEILRLVIDGYPTVLIDKKIRWNFTGFGTDGQCAEHVAAGSVFFGNREEKIGFITVEETETSSLGERNEGFYQGISEYGMTPVGKCSLPYITYDNPVEVRGEIYRKQIAEYVERYSKELEGIVCGEYSVAMETEAVLEAKALKAE